MFPQHQVEYNVDLGSILWCNFSYEDGNPFGDVVRYLEVDKSHCQYMYCAPTRTPGTATGVTDLEAVRRATWAFISAGASSELKCGIDINMMVVLEMEVALYRKQE